MNLFFYSDHVIPENRKIDDRLLSEVGKSDPTVVWIPAGNSPEKIESFFYSRKRAYSELGVEDVSMIEIHQHISTEEKTRVLDCDILHLSGGNPYIFLENLRKNDLIEVIRHRAKKGGYIVGDSAGAMIMSPSIRICDFDRNSTPPAGFDHRSMELVNFEVHPHWGSFGATENQIVSYSNERNLTIYCIPDGSGLAVIGSKIELFGSITKIEKGKANKSAHTTSSIAPR